MFYQILNRKPVEEGSLQKKYDELVSKVDTKRLNNYLRRQVISHKAQIETKETLNIY